MSANNPIPVRLRDEFRAHMDAFNNEELPDGAWFAVLEEGAQQFIDRNRLKWACNNAAVHQYLRMANDKATHTRPPAPLSRRPDREPKDTTHA